MTKQTHPWIETDEAEAMAAQGEPALAPSPRPDSDCAPSCRFVCGSAGSGKTWWVMRQIESEPDWGLLCATTGIAAVNLGAITLNSALKYFDTNSLRDAYLSGQLARTLHEIARDYRNLVIDEISMCDGDQLDLIYRAAWDANRYVDIKTPMGIVLVGDFAQLPPVKAKWAFDAACWPRFHEGTTRLDKIWRQSDPEFLGALAMARAGDGAGAAERLTGAGLEWHTELEVDFDGTTIVAKNDQVDRYNALALDRLPGRSLFVQSRWWGRQRGEWKGIPERLEIKTGAYVMLLANEPDGAGGFEYVNGDCGHVVAYMPAQSGFPEHFRVRLKRNGAEVSVCKLVRDCSSKDEPGGWSASRDRVDRGTYVPRPHRDHKGRYVEGQVEYFPVRPAYCSTVHRSQGLSLDSVQIDIRNNFFKQPAMAYVAISRARTLQGLRIVGQAERFAAHCTVDPRIKAWL